MSLPTIIARIATTVGTDRAELEFIDGMSWRCACFADNAAS